ncbi:DUF4157 domain-containing protein [Actinoplanes sp. NPDC051633]|uniref:eCIS core domain-containing protein n=1 Tax=Actinoplanes sp. NPDC051633 TaxID=3155670 RepID=UPI003434BF16
MPECTTRDACPTTRTTRAVWLIYRIRSHRWRTGMLPDREPARVEQSAPRSGPRAVGPARDNPLLAAGNGAVTRWVQRLASGSPDARKDVGTRLAAAAGQGQALPSGVRNELESATGAPLAAVRVHTDADADGLTRDLGAQALTTGQDVYFRAGAYRLDSNHGYRVLAHEVAHTIQQSGAPALPSNAEVSVSHPDDSGERAAERAADTLVHARGSAAAPAVSMSSGPRMVQRFSGFEHESLGDSTNEAIDLGNGITLTWGQVVAIAGDEVGDVGTLQEMVRTDAGRRQLRAALEHASLRKPITSALPAPTKDETDAQKEIYVKLAMENVRHFAAGGDALTTWRSHHSQALQAALTAGLTGNDAEFQRAQLLEAFGQHFLTDMFSGGHVRTPRADIMAFHAGIAPPMAAALIAKLRERIEGFLVAQIMMQIGMAVGPPSMQAPPMPGMPSMRGQLSQDKAREKVKATVDGKVAGALKKIGGMAGLEKAFGLALAGAVSGALHDRDGREGVTVASEDHPEPWLALGDSKLDAGVGPPPAGSARSASRDQAEKAVLAAREQLLAARAAGQSETAIAKVAPTDPPTGLIVHFAFGSAGLDGAASEVAAAGAYLHTNPGTRVDLAGHTDQVGADEANMGLGQRRADAVRAALIAGGAASDQVGATSYGESSPITADPKRYGENRRVEFVWQSRRPVFTDPSEAQVCVDPIRQRAEAVIAGFGPPFPVVERYIPHEVPFLNEPLPDWRWGKLSPEIITEVDTWIMGMVGKELRDAVAAMPETEMSEGYTLTIRAMMEPIVDELLQGSPARNLGKLMGQPPG